MSYHTPLLQDSYANTSFKGGYNNMMKRILAVICLWSMILEALIIPGFNAKSSTKENVYNQKNVFLTAELKQNIPLMCDTFSGNNKKVYDDKSYAIISISEKLTEAEMIFFYKGSKNRILFNGEYNEVNLGDTKGFVAIYEGTMFPGKGAEYAINDDGTVTVLLDIIFTDSEAFAVITIGCATEKFSPDIIFYGEYTDLIGKISQINASKEVENSKRNNNTQTDVQKSVQAGCKHQGSAQIKMSNKTVGSINVFHANELKNQSDMSVYAKANTQGDNVINYLNNDYGFGSSVTLAYADKFSISICGNHNDFHAENNSYVPANNSTHCTIPVPVYLGSIAGVQVLDISLLTSSTTVTTSRYTSSSFHPNGRVSWEIYKLRGWNPNEFDGDHTTNNGMTGSASYTFEGDVYNTFVISMTSTAQIRYEYWVMVMGNLTAYHISTNSTSKTTYVKIKK